jgi:hypothetical protein
MEPAVPIEDGYVQDAIHNAADTQARHDEGCGLDRPDGARADGAWKASKGSE